MKKYFFVFLFFFLIGVCQAQILGNILGEATRKINRKVEEKLVQVISDEIVRRAFKPIDRTMDSLMRQQFQDSLGQTEKVDWDKWGEAYADYLKNMNTSVDLPETYEFNVVQKVESTHNKEKTQITLYYSESEGVFGIETEEKKEGKNIVVLDVKKDAAVMYTIDNKGQKSGQVVANFFKMTSAFANSAAVSEAQDNDLKISATGKTKTIAGYKCQEYKGESSDENITLYLTQEFPVSKDKSMEAFFMKFAPEAYNKNNSYKALNGVMLEYENISKTKKSDTSQWITQSVKKEKFVLNNKDYGLGSK